MTPTHMTEADVDRWRDGTAVDNDGDKIGSIDEIYVDHDTGRPEWLAVKTGMFGNKVSFIPIAGAEMADDDKVHVAYGKAQVKDAPQAEPDGELSADEEDALYRHYGMGRDDARDDGGHADHTEGHGDADRSEGHDTSGPTTDDAMTRSEEELNVDTVRREKGRARLRKHVVTENVETTVPVQREEVRVEREPITDANAGAAVDGPGISEEEHEVVLHEEQVVTEKRVVPKERVSLGTETVTDEQTVSEDVRKEQIETDSDDR